jgi:hypothetical protein
MAKCRICGERIRRDEESYYSYKLQGDVCSACYDAELSSPMGTVLVYRPRLGVVEKYTVMQHEDHLVVAVVEDGDDLLNPRFDYDHLETEARCPIQFEWHRTDPWRGYYEPTGDGWVRIHDDAILWWSRDAEELERFHDKALRMLWGLGQKGVIGDFAVAYGSTSNLFSTGYDLLVQSKDVALTLPAIKILALQHRDPDRFALTALTGKSEGFDEKDRLLLEAWRRIQGGEDPQRVQEDILRRVGEDEAQEAHQGE